MGTVPNWKEITGWLAEPAALFTEYLIKNVPSLEQQPGFEIGVFMGKYLSVIHDATRARVVGYDLFAHGPRHLAKVEEQFDSLYGESRRMILHATDSKLLSPARVRRDIEAACAGVISIDGSHERDDVMTDLLLANELLSASGFIAFDDFLNPNCLGVNEAFYRVMFGYSSDPVDLAPFAYVTNKLFLCRPAEHSTFYDLGARFVQSNLDKPWMTKVKQQISQGIKTTYDLVGHDIVRVNH